MLDATTTDDDSCPYLGVESQSQALPAKKFSTQGLLDQHLNVAKAIVNGSS